MLDDRRTRAAAAGSLPATTHPIGRLPSLDSLRGVAAAIVVLHHAALALDLGEQREELLRHGYASPLAWLYLSPLRLLVAGPAMVLLFFVLSGLVLAMPATAGRGDRYGSFVIKRLTRIWPPFAVVVLASAALAAVSYQGPVAAGSPWFNLTWSDGFGARVVAEHLLMTGASINLDNPMWSLIIELRLSLVFPAILLAVRGSPLLAIAAALLAAVAVVKTGPVGPAEPGGLAISLLSTLAYLPLFVVGAGLAMYLADLRKRFAQTRGSIHLLLWLLALVMLCCGPEYTNRLVRLRDLFSMLVASAGATLIVLLSAVEGRALVLLLGRGPAYLGRISYSLYLVHVVVMATMARALQGIVPFALTIVVSLPLSIVAADLCQRLIEVPATRLGRRLAKAADGKASRLA